MTKAGCALLAALLLSCHDQASDAPSSWITDAELDAGPATARWDMVANLREDLAMERHPADGGGRAWLQSGDSVQAGRQGRWVLVYEAGPLGVAEGGAVLLQVSPFWGWSTPQLGHADLPGYTEVQAVDLPQDDPLKLQAATMGDQLLGISIAGRALAEGERIRIDYGAGSAGAVADRFAERGSRFWVAVDGDGDGIRQVLADSPAVDVAPGPAAGMVLTLPSTARPGQRVRLSLALLDSRGNAGIDMPAQVALRASNKGLDLPAALHLEPGDKGRRSVEFLAEKAGIYQVAAEGPGGMLAESNLLLVSKDVPAVRWADLHGHSGLSDGTGSPDDYYGYARDVAGLDFAALTDHDHWGMLFLDQHPALWDEIRAATQRHHQPGRFVTLLGYEWTSWIHGHRHVLYFDERGEVFSSLDPRYEAPQGLWKALRGYDALSIPHHTAGGPVAGNLDIPPDPQLEPVVEIVSVHGSSEAHDSPGGIYSPVPGHYARDALERGYRMGFIGSGDTHDGHPGLAYLANRSGGLAAVIGAGLERSELKRALQERRTYATNGPRILLFTTIDGQPMGSLVAPAPQAELSVFVLGQGPLQAVDLIRTGRSIERLPGDGALDLQATIPLQELKEGEAFYVRVLQEDGGAAWSSPFFVSSDSVTLPQ